MCCGRKNRRTPAVVVLGKMAMDKYQERKARNSIANREPSPDPFVTEERANAEILQRAGIEPPSYDASVSRNGSKQQFAGGHMEKGRQYSSDLSESEYSNEFEVVSPELVQQWRSRGEAWEPVLYMSKKDKKRAEEWARNVEKKGRQ